MANETLECCIDPTNENKVKCVQISKQATPCNWCAEENYPCVYYGCIDWVDGKPQITISTRNCEDTYKGCVDWTTGKIKIIVPNNCCDEMPQPRFFDVTVAGLQDGECQVNSGSCKAEGVAAACNGVWRVEHVVDCYYDACFNGGFGNWKHWLNDDCSGNPYEDYTFLSFRPFAKLYEDLVYFNMKVYTHIDCEFASGSVFHGQINYLEGDKCGDTDNSGDSESTGWCGDIGRDICIGGNVTIEVVW